MNRYLQDIKEKTKDMDRKQKTEYVLTYYWYHILGICGGIFLMVFLIVHFAFGSKQPEFTCAIVNQRIDYDRDGLLAEMFAESSDIQEDEVVVDSDYIISYEDHELEGNNESSYEKFFFKWSGGELDAIIMPESFLTYCTEMGGSYYDIEEMGIDGLEKYELDGVAVGFLIEGSELKEYLETDESDPIILVFPKEGTHLDNCRKFVEFIQ